MMLKLVCDYCGSVVDKRECVSIPEMIVYWKQSRYPYKELHFCDGECFRKWYNSHTMSDGSWQE